MASQPIPFWTNFTAGQIDEILDGRVDLAKYNNGVRVMHNVLPFQQGGAKGRPGTRYVTLAKYVGKKVCLIPFSFSVHQNYVLEVGHLYIRIFTEDGQLVSGSGPELISNNQFNVNLSDWLNPTVNPGASVNWDWSQRARFQQTTTESTASFSVLQQGFATTPGTRYRLSFEVSVGTLTMDVGTSAGLANTLAHENFEPRPVPYVREFVASAGTSYVEFYLASPNPAVAYLDNVSCKVASTPIEIATPYNESELFELKYTQSADVLYITHPNHPQKQLNRQTASTWTLTDFVGNPPATVEGGLSHGSSLTLSATSGTGITVEANLPTFLEADVGRTISGKAGEVLITDYIDADTVSGDVIIPPTGNTLAPDEWVMGGSPGTGVTPSATGPVGAIIDLVFDDDALRSAPDGGKYLLLWDGVVRLNNISSAVTATAQVISVLSSTAKAIAGNWTLEVTAWDANQGFPRTVGFYDQRLFFAGSDSAPDTLLASKTGRFNNFGRGANDDAALKYVLSAGQVNMIEWIMSGRDLIVGTSGAEFKVTGGINEPLTPSNVLAKPETAWGSASIMPCRVDRAVVFVQLGGKVLRAISYNFDVDGYVASDLTLLAPSIGKSGIVQVTFEKLPVPTIYGIRNDGTLIALVYDPGQDVAAWSEHTTGGDFESVCSIIDPTGTKGRTWVSVKRTIGGLDYRYIEYFDQAELINEEHPLTGVDSALSYDGTNNLAAINFPDIVGVPIPGAVGAGITTRVVATAAQTFRAGDVGKEIVQIGGTGRAIITEFTDSQTVVVRTTTSFPHPGPYDRGQWGLAVNKVLGLEHLEGHTVAVKGDGAAYGSYVVGAGQVNLIGPHALKIDVGLPYIPMITTLRPGVNIRNGNSVFLTKGYNKLYIFFKDTLGATVNDLPLEFRSSEDLMDEAPPLTTAIVDATEFGYDSNARITIKQPQPLPFMVLAIAGKLNVGDE
jgi:hypothetical protein